MTILRNAAMALLVMSGSAFAQTPSPSVPAAPASQAAPASSSSADLTKDGKPRMKIVRAQCKDEVKGQNLKGDARKQAMAACIIKQRPDMEARVKCQMDPSLKGMDKASRKEAMKSCMAKAKG